MSRTLHNIKPQKIIDFLEEKLFVLKRIHGSHHIFFNEETKKIASVPVHTKNIPIGTTLSIIKQAGYKAKDFLDYLA